MASLDNARKLLQRLASDDEFRRKVEADPIGSFAEYGFKIDPQSAPASVKLPAKQDILDNLESLSREFESTSGVVVFAR